MSDVHPPRDLRIPDGVPSIRCTIEVQSVNRESVGGMLVFGHDGTSRDIAPDAMRGVFVVS
jgi:hypothetical protein